MNLWLQPVVLASSVFLLSGCGVSGAPSCSDSEVTNLVLQIAGENLGNALVKAAIDSDRNLLGEAVTLPYPHTYDSWKDNPPEGVPGINALLTRVGEQLASMNVTAIRTNETDDEIQKCSCSGQLDLSGLATLPIDYTGQYTEDSQIWVEVFGIQ